MPSRRRVHQAPVIALDIDGTLGDYHTHFTKFAEKWVGREMPDPLENTGGEPLYKWLGMSKSTYRQCKLAFRQGGLKRSMPVYPYVKEAVRTLRKDADVWICTTRPYLRLDSIDPDTRHWLRRNGIQYDGVLFGEHKYRDLHRIVGGERIVCVVDDEPEHFDRAAALGMYPILRTQPYNLYRGDIARRCDDTFSMLASCQGMLQGWRETHARLARKA